MADNNARQEGMVRTGHCVRGRILFSGGQGMEEGVEGKGLNYV